MNFFNTHPVTIFAQGELSLIQALAISKNKIMRRKKGFEYQKGVYYFNVKSGAGNGITIKRKKKNDAIQAFSRYLTVNKDVEWYGKWDGKNFTEADFEKLVAA